MAKIRRAGGSASAVRKVVRKVASKRDPHPEPMLRIGVPVGKERRPKAACALPTRGRGEKGSAAKRKGGPVPGTPSPTRTRMTPELQAHVKRLYEETDQPVCQIALDVGVNESVIRRMGPREGWVRYVAPPRDLPPVALLLAEVKALESDRHPEVRAERASKEDGQAEPASFEGGLRPPPQDDAQKSIASRDENIARLIRIVMAHSDELEAVRRNGKLLAKQHLETARAINILTDAFNTLQRLRASLTGPIHDDTFDMPADLDAYRVELARRIEEFLRSRPDIGNGDGAADEAVESA